VARGAEVGRFNLGSTVILLLEQSDVDWSLVQPGQWIAMGSKLAEREPERCKTV
jgi:phosphatidylserine decarboxylase